jgi:hypothetical protein
MLAVVLIIGFIGLLTWEQDNATVLSRIIKQRSIAAGILFSTCIGGVLVTSLYWIVIWFQALKGISVVKSGINTISMALSLTVGAIIFSGAVQRIDYYVSSMYIGVVLIFIGAGLMTSFQRETSFRKRIDYQILLGFDIGVSTQQSILRRKHAGSNRYCHGRVAHVLWSVTGQRGFHEYAQAIFNDHLTLNSRNVGLDVHSVIKIGATELIKMVFIENVDMVIQVYNKALKNFFILVTVIAAFAIVLTLLMKMKKLKQKPESRESPEKKEEA